MDKSVFHFTLKLESINGSDILESFIDAHRIATLLGVLVSFDCNQVEVLICSKDDPIVLFKKYEAGDWNRYQDSQGYWCKILYI